MNTERLIRIFAGSFVLVSLALGVQASPVFVSRHFLWFTAFVGLNLLQSGFTGFCPLAIILRRTGVCGVEPSVEPSGVSQAQTGEHELIG